MTIRKFIRDQGGEGYVDFGITLLIVFALVASIFSIFPLYTTHQSLTATVRQIAHVVEVTGQADSATVALVTSNDNFIEPDSISFDTVWHNASARKIQLKTPFTVTITKTVLIPIIRPLGADPIGIRINITASAAGISEVYWKG